MNCHLPELQEKANRLPLLPGVYMMLDEGKNIIYIGKAKKLKNRVTSYFHGEHLPKVAAMVEKVCDFNVVVVNSEFEALMLENSLIKQHKPHYNILLKDDKGYPYVRLDASRQYPVFTIVSKTGKDKARYFGPYGGRQVTRDLLRELYHALLLPDCGRKFPADIGKDRPCLNYHMNLCAGWCLKDQTAEDYRQRIDQAMQILEGNSADLIAELQMKMTQAAEDYRFEYAAMLRDRLRAVENLRNQQKVISTCFSDTDAFGIFRGSYFCLSILHYAGGNLISKTVEMLEDPLESDEEALFELLQQYYSAHQNSIPKTVLIPMELESVESLEQLLTHWKGKKVNIEVPKRGDRAELVNTAVMNSKEEILRRVAEGERRLKTLETLQTMLNLEHYPKRIESYDISNLGDTGIVSAMVVFQDGKPARKEYRKFRIKDLPVHDDYASMYQTIFRRFRDYKEKDEKFSRFPDLLLIDGGQVHAATAERALSDLGLFVPTFGMVKDDRHRTRALCTSDGREIAISSNQAIFSQIGKIQEETHRFAIEYQRSLRYESYGSVLDKIPGIGEKRKADLLREFKTVKAIREANTVQLSKVVPLKTAQEIFQYFHEENGDEK